VATRKVKRFNEGGDAGYGYGEGAGAAQGSGAGGEGRDSEGAFNSEGDIGDGIYGDGSYTNKEGTGGVATDRGGVDSDGSFSDQENNSGVGKKGGSVNTKNASIGKYKGGMIKKYAKGGTVSSASSRGDGIAQRGKTKGRMC